MIQWLKRNAGIIVISLFLITIVVFQGQRQMMDAKRYDAIVSENLLFRQDAKDNQQNIMWLKKQLHGSKIEMKEEVAQAYKDSISWLKNHISNIEKDLRHEIQKTRESINQREK